MKMRNHVDELMDQARAQVRMLAAVEAWQRSDRERMEQEFQADLQKHPLKCRFYADFGGFYNWKPTTSF